jgi:hypothetical protein
MRIPVILVLTLIFTSCARDVDNKGGIKGNGVIIKENRTSASNFDTVVASENLRVFIIQSDHFNIVVEADENIINLIGTDINDGKLLIHTHRNIGRATKKVYISLPNVSSLISSTGSILQTQGALKVDSLSIVSNTGSFLNAEIYAKEVSINGKEGARFSISGEANETSINVSSGSMIDGKELQTINCSAVASYGGSVEIMVSKSLMADSSTGGTISYLGEPIVDRTKSFSGNVQKY